MPRELNGQGRGHEVNRAQKQNNFKRKNVLKWSRVAIWWHHF